jgi:Do/DeqQ family serine protease
VQIFRKRRRKAFTGSQKPAFRVSVAVGREFLDVFTDSRMTSLLGRARVLLVFAAVLALAGCNRQNKAEQERQVAALGAHPTPKGLPTLAPMLAKVSPAVVNISVVGTRPVQNPLFQNPRFHKSFGPSQKSQTEHFWAIGSGVIIDAAHGYVVTNNHVVENAQRIQVTLSDRRQREVKLVGTDPQSDIAILKINAGDLKGIPFGTSKDLQVGDYVAAIGDPFGIGQTATLGIVSALGRTDLGLDSYEDFIQTDAAINPGNSGGALVNTAGQLVGMNTAIFSESGDNVGVGFAIPVDMIRTIAGELIRSGKVSRGSLGVVIQDLTPAIARAMGSNISAGALVSQVKPSSPAAKAGTKSEDVITRMNGIVIASSNDLRNAISQEPPGAVVHLALLRNDRELTASVKLVASQEAAMTQSNAPGPQANSGGGLLSGAKTGAIPPGNPNHGKVNGVYLTGVAPKSIAAAAGLRQGDIILDADRKPVATIADFDNVVKVHPAGRPLLLRISRGSAFLFLALG